MDANTDANVDTNADNPTDTNAETKTDTNNNTTTNTKSDSAGDKIAKFKDAGKYSGVAAERLAKEVGLAKYAKKIGAFISKLVGKKQKEYMDGKNGAVKTDAAAAPAPAAAPVAAPVVAH